MVNLTFLIKTNQVILNLRSWEYKLNLNKSSASTIYIVISCQLPPCCSIKTNLAILASKQLTFYFFDQLTYSIVCVEKRKIQHHQELRSFDWSCSILINIVKFELCLCSCDIYLKVARFPILGLHFSQPD